MQKQAGIPDGFHTITPYLFYRNGAEAMAFYEKAFGGVTMLCLKKQDGSILHAEMRIGDSMIMLTDVQDADAPIHTHLFLYVADVDAFINRAVEAGAKLVAAPETKWEGDRRGGVDDLFGKTWWVATQVQVMSRAELQRDWNKEHTK